VISPSLQKPVMVSEPLTVGKSIQSHALQIMWRCAVQTVGGATRLDTPCKFQTSNCQRMRRAKLFGI
jgi:hypothetical protein